MSEQSKKVNSMSELFKTTCLFFILLFLILLGVWINVYAEHTRIDQKQLELSQDADQREICRLALDAYRDSKYYPFSDAEHHVDYVLPDDCVGIIR